MVLSRYARWDAVGDGDGLTSVVIRITVIGMIAGSIFQSNNVTITTIAKLAFIAASFDGVKYTARKLADLWQHYFIHQQIYREQTQEYQCVMAFLTEKRIIPKAKVGTSDLKSPASFWWKGCWIKVTHYEVSYIGEIEIKMYTLRSSAINDFLFEAKKQDLDYATVYTPTSGANGVAYSKMYKPCRPMDSTSLSIDALSSLIEECGKYWESEDWYTNIGLPYRKGYLLHGPPGSGKSDAVYALACRLGRVVYSAITYVPKGSIFLIENIDYAFKPSSASTPPVSQFGYSHPPASSATCANATSTGILNMLDAAARADGVLVFATTSTIDDIDQAVFQPGRIDKKIEFKYSTKEQSSTIFKKFFPNVITAPKQADVKPCYNDLKVLPFADLSEQFSSRIPEDAVTIRDIRQYLMPHQFDPNAAIDGVDAWVITKREEKTKSITEKKRLLTEAERQAKEQTSMMHTIYH